MRYCAAPAFTPAQRGMTPILVVKHLVIFELPLKICLVSKPDPVQILAPDGSDQPLDERMRTGRTGNGFDLVDVQHPKVRALAMKAEQPIVIGRKGAASRGDFPLSPDCG